MSQTSIEPDLLVKAPPVLRTGPVAGILVAISVSHLLNDLMQSLVPSVYPILKSKFALDFGQVGLISLTFYLTASLLQPVVGLVTDRRPMPFSLPVGMASTLAGLLLLSVASSFATILLAAGMIGLGSAVFHPESSRVARMASGGRHGLAQSVFQVGGNAGSAIGPLLAAFVVVRHGQSSIAWFSIAALLAMAVLALVGRWYGRRVAERRRVPVAAPAVSTLPRARVVASVAILLTLIFSKYFYMASLGTYYTFYLIDRFGVAVDTAQLLLFVFLGSVAVGTVVGGPLGDRFGRKRVIWVSILGVLPFTLALPHVNLLWTAILTVPIGLILASAFSAILVYAQDLLPGRVGLVGGLFFGFAFGMGGLGAAVLGRLADATSIEHVYALCAYLPALGLLTALLPDTRRRVA